MKGSLKMEPRLGLRLGTKKFVTVDSDAVTSIDYSQKLKLLEVEFRDNQKIYHYLQVSKSIYENLLKLKKIKESLKVSGEKDPEHNYSIGKFINLEVKPRYDYYDLSVSGRRRGIDLT